MARTRFRANALHGCLASLLVAGAAGVARAMLPARFSFDAAFAVLMGATLWALSLLRQSREPRAGVGASLGILGWVPALFVGSSFALSTNFVEARWLCGNGIMGLIVLAPFALLFCLAVSTAAATLVDSLAPKRPIDLALRALAIGSVAVGLLAVGLALTHATRPDPDTYLASLPVVERLAFPSAPTVGGQTLSYTAKVKDATSDPNARACILEGIADAREIENFVGAPGPESCPPLLIVHDAKADLYFVRREADLAPLFGFKGNERRSISIGIRDVSLAPPVGWTAGATIAVAGGIVLLGCARRLRRRARSPAESEGVHRGDGWLEVPEGPTVHVPAAISLPVGPVVFATGPARREPAYRDAGVPDIRLVRAGTLADVRALLLGRAASLDAIAFVTVVLGVVPLAAARCCGL